MFDVRSLWPIRIVRRLESDDFVRIATQRHQKVLGCVSIRSDTLAYCRVFVGSELLENSVVGGEINPHEESNLSYGSVC
jgi:hypothetical protein